MIVIEGMGYNCFGTAVVFRTPVDVVIVVGSKMKEKGRRKIESDTNFLPSHVLDGDGEEIQELENKI